MPRRRLLLALLTVVCVVTACGRSTTAPQDSAKGFPVTVDRCGQPVTIEQPPHTVLTMGTDPPTLLAAAGAADQIDVRAAEFGFPLGHYHDELADIPVISPTQEPSTEVIIGTGADLVITYGLNKTDPATLHSAGIDVLIPSGRCDASVGDAAASTVNFRDIYRDIREYGRLFGTTTHATDTIEQLQARVAAAKRTVATSTIKASTAAAVYFSGHSLSAYGNSSMAHTQIETLGLNNVFGGVDKRTFETSVEELIARDPDVIIVLRANGPDATANQAIQKLRSLPGAATVTALRTDRVIPLGYTYLGGGPLAIDGLEKIATELTTPQ